MSDQYDLDFIQKPAALEVDERTAADKLAEQISSEIESKSLENNPLTSQSSPSGDFVAPEDIYDSTIEDTQNSPLDVVSRIVNSVYDHFASLGERANFSPYQISDFVVNQDWSGLQRFLTEKGMALGEIGAIIGFGTGQIKSPFKASVPPVVPPVAPALSGANVGLSTLSGLTLNKLPLWAVPIVAGASFGGTSVFANMFTDLINKFKQSVGLLPPEQIASRLDQIEKIVLNKTYMSSLSVEDRITLWSEFIALLVASGKDVIPYPYNDIDSGDDLTTYQRYLIQRDEERGRKYYSPEKESWEYIEPEPIQYFKYEKIKGMDSGLNGYGQEQSLDENLNDDVRDFTEIEEKEMSYRRKPYRRVRTSRGKTLLVYPYRTSRARLYSRRYRGYIRKVAG